MIDPADIAEDAIAVAQHFQDRNIPAWLIYHDANGWHLAGPKVPGSALAEGLRSVAAQCEEQLPSGPLN